MVESLDKDMASQTIEDGLKYTISKTQENVQLVKAFQINWNPEEGEVLQAYIHGQTEKGSGMGRIGTLIHLASTPSLGDVTALDTMASQLTKHIAAMKPAYLKENDIPDSVRQEILDGENGKKALKKYIKRDVLWEQELATAEKAETVGKFFKTKSRDLKTTINVENWALFVIE